MQIQRAAISHTLRFRLSGPWRLETMGRPRDELRAQALARGAVEQDGVCVANVLAFRVRDFQLTEGAATSATLQQVRSDEG